MQRSTRKHAPPLDDAIAAIAAIASIEIDSPVGPLRVEADAHAVRGVHFVRRGERSPARDARAPAAARGRVERCARELAEYFRGERRDFDVLVRPRGTPFQERVWQALRRIPFGRTASYGDIARAIGLPKAARAVGGANNRNPVAIVIPCHRVVGADARLVGYGGGLDKKVWLLAHESKVETPLRPTAKAKEATMGRTTAVVASLACSAWIAAVATLPSLAAAQQPAPAPALAPASATGKSAAEKPAGRVEYFELQSKVLEQSLNVGVYVPPDYDQSKERYPAIYFLHGLYGSARKWAERKTNETLDELISDGKMGPVLVVCPDGKNSMYVNGMDGKNKWADFVATELVTTIDAKYRTLADRATRGINGDSMGGYGAINIAFKHPDVFGSVSAHSAAIYPIDPQQIPDWIKQRGQQWAPIYGWPIDVPHWEEWNPLKEARTLPEESLKKLKIYFDCGDHDKFGFETTNAELHKILDERKVAHEWHLRSGNHGRDYFEENVQFSLLFHGAIFDAAPRSAKPGANANH